MEAPPPFAKRASDSRSRLSPRGLAAGAAGLVALLAGLPVPAQERPAQAPKPATKCLLWRIRHGADEGWLFGTFHLATKDLYPLPPAVEAAFRRSASLVVPADFAAIDPEAVRKAYADKGFYPEDDSLWDHLDEATAAEVKAALRRQKIPEDTAARLRPWYLAEMIYWGELNRLGLDPELALDRHFLKQAGDRPVLGLLTLDRVIAVSSEGGPRLHELKIRFNLAEARMVEADPQTYWRLWRTGDVGAMEEIDRRTLKEHPEFKPVFEAGFERPAAELTDGLEKVVKARRTPFAMIPAGFLIGEKGMLRLLRERKFEVEQVDGGGE